MEPGLDKIWKRRARSAKGIVLLALLAHALFLSATHFHRVAGLAPAGVQGAAVSRPEDGPKAPLSNGEEQCLVCRLQRNFASGLMRHAAPEVAPPAARPLAFAALEQTSTPSAPKLTANGRGPPLS